MQLSVDAFLADAIAMTWSVASGPPLKEIKGDTSLFTTMDSIPCALARVYFPEHYLRGEGKDNHGSRGSALAMKFWRPVYWELCVDDLVKADESMRAPFIPRKQSLIEICSAPIVYANSPENHFTYTVRTQVAQRYEARAQSEKTNVLSLLVRQTKRNYYALFESIAAKEKISLC